MKKKVWDWPRPSSKCKSLTVCVGTAVPICCALQMSIKTVFDPQWLLNPAKVFPLDGRPPVEPPLPAPTTAAAA